MIHFSKVIVISLTLILSLVANAGPLSKNRVEKFIDSFDTAIVGNDFRGIANAFSDNASITTNVRYSGQEALVTQTKKEYLIDVKKSWGHVSDYQLKRLDMEIEILGQRAFVSAKLKEKALVDGRYLFFNSTEELILKVVDDNIVIIKRVNVGQMM